MLTARTHCLRLFSKAPRLTVYKCKLYDWAECINLCPLLRNQCPAVERALETVVSGILADWVKPEGSFRSRKLICGWTNVPMPRQPQSQMFRSLAFYLQELVRGQDGKNQKSLPQIIQFPDLSPRFSDSEYVRNLRPD